MKKNHMGYRAGDRLRMIECKDPLAPIPTGSKGTIRYIDDAGTLHMLWDDGRTLGVCLEEDVVERLEGESIRFSL